MKIGGYLIVQGDGRPLEFDSLRCCHCQRVIFIKPGTSGQIYLIPDNSPSGHHEEPGAYCAKCYGPICIPCDNGTCVPWEKALELEEAAARQRR